jgi:alkaline phosphatase
MKPHCSFGGFSRSIIFGVMGFCTLASFPSEPGSARNVILCIGDGMGTEHGKAARFYTGTNLSFDSFPFYSEMTTDNVSGGTTDSAASATAMSTGTKVNNEVLAVQVPGDRSELETMLEYFQQKGKSTGLVTTSYLTHATPAAFGAHEHNRDRHNQIADDYLSQTRPDILMGGGANGLSASDVEAAGYTVVQNTAELLALNTDLETTVCGLFGSYHLPYELDGLGNLPHLHQMTATTLDILDNNPDGFFLLIEGARIDHASHANDIQRTIHETIAFSRAVETVIQWMDSRTDTLIVVTSDHETGGLTVRSDNGPGNYPTVSWSTTWHTSTEVPVYAIGNNAHLITNVTDNTHIHSALINATLPPDQILNILINATGFHLTWSSHLSYIYSIEYNTNLLTASWTPLNTITAQTDHITFSDPAPTRTNCFYRIIKYSQ